MGRVRSTDGIRVEGLAELSASLKELDRNLERELRSTNRTVARFVASEAQATASSLGGVAAHVAPSVRASAGATSAGVTIGGPSEPAAAGAEFGGGARPTTQQFEPWRGRGEGAGYFVYPTIRRDAERIEQEYAEALESVIRKAGLR